MRSQPSHPFTPVRTPLAQALTLVLLATAGQALAQTEQNMGTVVVTAAGFEQDLRDAPASITVISGDELRNRSYTDITDALKNVAGVQIAGGGVERSIMLRGMTADYTLFLIDGRPMQGNDAFANNGAQAGNSVNFLPPIEAIERIEVIRGPASALYGSDAMGGVINIITRKVHNEWSGSITTEYSHADSSNKTDEDGFLTNFYLNAPLIQDTLSLQITGGFQNQDEGHFAGGSDSAASDPEYKKKNLGTKLAWRVNDTNTLTLGNTYTLQERWHNPGLSLADTGTASYQKSIKNSYFLNHEGQYGSLLTNTYAQYEKSENPTRVNATTGNGIEFSVLTLNTQATYFLDSHTLTGGVNYKYENLEDGATNGLNLPGVSLPTDIIKMDRYQYSLFLEDEWTILDNLALTLSGRYDDNEKFGGQFSPKIYAVYHLTDTLTLKGGVTTGFRAPTLKQSATDYGSTSMGGVIIGNPDLKPETSLNREIGLGYQNNQIGLASTLTVYQIDYEDKINRTGRICPAAADNPNQDPCVYNGTTYPYHQFGYTAYENVDKAELTGVEHTLSYRIFEDLTYRHSYTYTDTEQKTGTYAGEPLNDVSKHMFNASLDWQTTDRLNLWTQVNYRGKTSGRWQTGTSGSSSNGVTYPSYTFADLGLAYRPIDPLNLKAGIYNVTNKTVSPDEDYSATLDGRKLVVSFTYSF